MGKIKKKKFLLLLGIFPCLLFFSVNSFAERVRPNSPQATRTYPQQPPMVNSPPVNLSQPPVQMPPSTQGQQGMAPETDTVLPLSPPNLGARSTWDGEAIDQQSQQAAQGLINEAFTRSLKQTMPFSPNRIQQLRELGIQVEGAQQHPPAAAGTTRFRALSLKPGAVIPSVKLYPGNVTVVRILDATGAPWPILSYMVGNAQAFSVRQGGGETSNATNTLMITPTSNVSSANLALILYPDTPCVLQLNVNALDNTAEFLITFKVDSRGPMASESFIQPEMTSQVSPLMLSFLDGIPPQGAVPLKMSDAEVEGWRFGKKTYLRVQNKQLLWPGYSKTVSSGGQVPVYVYELPDGILQYLFSSRMGNIDVLATPYPDTAVRAMQEGR